MRPGLCRAVIPDCADCATASWAADGHECDDLCQTMGENMRASQEFHLSIVPLRCDCGTPLDNQVHAECGYKRCDLSFCPGCRRETIHCGPADCPCRSRSGHGTQAEFKRPGAGRWVKASKRRR